MVFRKLIRLPWIAAGGLVLCVLPLRIAMAACERPPTDPILKIQTKTDQLSYDTSQGLRTLTARARAEKAQAVPATNYSMGLTAAKWRSEARIELSGAPVDGDQYCWSISSITITVRLQSTILVAKEIPRGSCAWEQVIAHENKHVTLDRKLFVDLPARVRAKVEPHSAQAILAKKGETALKKFKADIGATISRELAAFISMRNERQVSTIDTAAEYQRVSDACSDAEWIAIFERSGLSGISMR